MEIKPETAHHDSQLHTELSPRPNFQPSTGPGNGSLDTSLASSTNVPMSIIMPKPHPAAGLKPSKGERNQYILPEADTTRAQQSEKDAMKERNCMVPKTSKTVCQIVDSMERKLIVARAGKEKKLSRKMRRALEREQKTRREAEAAFSEVPVTGKESIKLVGDTTPGTDLGAASLKHRFPEKTGSINIIPVTILPTIASENAQASQFVHSGVALPEIDSNVVITKQHNDEVSEFEAKGITADREASASSKWCDQERNQHVGPIRRSSNEDNIEHQFREGPWDTNARPEPRRNLEGE
ncbi:uncharacterized protein EV420DRAFT_1557067 [Desarmillaria tabescens]|uniref:Uncharacterized protein n=1 Tax=Armillaria tabescens TaxID=1929756 RepID=A0AA39K1W0_ARMTA|nr:uncharacterized protein EV420DRAFT_1557067 [Desarmillaria tabescens]KAK0452858.1 hypothetical protein EV420DRAFT_1557067 [Desarmillaria tabescens]